ncbi:MAG: iron-sulfur cluster carrier protein ApbC [Xanthomonadales bacterium]|nr:iron-sulfur cluster carrier protein ApbC [Xanthomonadales bacterium]
MNNQTNCIDICINPLTQLNYHSQFELNDSELSFRFPFEGFEQQISSSLQGCKIQNLKISSKIVPHKTKQGIDPIDGIKNIIAVASGKGGVGKSTVTVMLAKSLQKLGAKVAILDADIYGPSMPRMLGDYGKPGSPDNKSFIPVNANGIQSMSLGYMIDEESPAIWRGSMITRALMQMVEETRWGNIDYLLIDLPPGTGDIQLTMVQKIPVTATVIVTTPQDISLIDAQKAFNMFKKVELPVLGVIENMSLFHCPNCNHEFEIFGKGAGQRMQEKFSTQLLGQLPLNINIREQMDEGKPEKVWGNDSEVSQIGLKIAMKVAQTLASFPVNLNRSAPELKLHSI